MKKISYIIYKILRTFDRLVYLITKRSFLNWFSDYFNEDFYSSKILNNKKTNFFVPNQIIQWRVNTIFSKEPETIDWINKFKNKDRIIFWDIGANIGLYSIYAAQKFKNIKVYAFEPSTSNLRVLSRNISINNLYDKIFINQFPLSDKTKNNTLMNEPEFIEGWAMNAYGEPFDYQGKKFKVKKKYNIFGTNINFLLDHQLIEMPNYIKIDVDGIEDKIIAGGDKYLKNKRLKSISVEINEDYKSQYERIIKILSKNNFIIKYKKHAKFFDQDQKFANTYNYIFEKK